MVSKEYIKINPEEKNRKIMLDQTKEIVISKADKPYSLILELPEGSWEKYDFEADREYLISYNKKINHNNNRSLIGDVVDVSFNIIA
jgi:ribosome biogenesis protein Tsr3